MHLLLHLFSIYTMGPTLLDLWEPVLGFFPQEISHYVVSRGSDRQVCVSHRRGNTPALLRACPGLL